MAEVKQLAKEVTDIGGKTEFNGIKLLDGTGGTSGTITFQVGANQGETIDVVTKDVLGASGTVAVDGVSDTGSWEAVTLDNIDTAINNVSTIRAEFGAVQNRLEHRLAQPRDLPGEPGGVREPDPRRGHGR